LYFVSINRLGSYSKLPNTCRTCHFAVAALESSSEQESKSAFSWSTVAAMGLSVLVLSFVIPAAYGAVSGDYSALRTVAEYVKDIVEVVASHAGT
jgi:hypothetical protein